MKKIALVLIVAIMVITTLTGCGPESSSYDFSSLYQCKTDVVDQTIVKKMYLHDNYNNVGSYTINSDSSCRLLIIVLQVVKPKGTTFKLNSNDVCIIPDDENLEEGPIFKGICMGIKISKSQPAKSEKIDFQIEDVEDLYCPVAISYGGSDKFFVSLIFDLGTKELPVKVWISNPSNIIIKQADENNDAPDELFQSTGTSV